MKPIPNPLAEQCWAIAAKVTWTAEDWADFYHALTSVFLRIAARHAKRKIEEAETNRPH